MSDQWIVVLESKDTTDLQYLADWPGDPGRTCVLENAKRYNSAMSATFGLAHARRYHEYPRAKIRKIEKE